MVFWCDLPSNLHFWSHLFDQKMTHFLPLFDPSRDQIGRPTKIPEPSHSDDSGTCKVTVNETPIFDLIFEGPDKILRPYFDPI